MVLKNARTPERKKNRWVINKNAVFSFYTKIRSFEAVLTIREMSRTEFNYKSRPVAINLIVGRDKHVVTKQDIQLKASKCNMFIVLRNTRTRFL
jgi:hypothetical protein